MKLNAKFLGRCLEGLFLLLIPVIIIYSIINVFSPGLLIGEKVLTSMEDLYGFNMQKLSLLRHSLFIVVSIIGTAFIVSGFWFGAKIARLFGNREFFTESSAQYFTKLKKMTFFWGLYNVTQMVFCSKIFMPKMPLKLFFISIGMMSLFHLLIFIVFAAIAGVITRGARLQKDQDLTV